MYGNNVPATICEQVAPSVPTPALSSESAPGLGEVAQICDGILSDCLGLGVGCLQFMLGEDAMPVEKLAEPQCLRDSLYRCRAQAETLRQLLMRLRKGLG